MTSDWITKIKTECAPAGPRWATPDEVERLVAEVERQRNELETYALLAAKAQGTLDSIVKGYQARQEGDRSSPPEPSGDAGLPPERT